MALYNQGKLVENGQFVVVRDSDGNKVAFSSFEEFNKYYPALDLTGKNYIDYEPDRKIYLDDTNVDENNSLINLWDGNVVTAYEDVIAQTSTLKTNKEDPYFGKTIDEAKEIKKNELKLKARQIITEKYPDYMQLNYANNVPGYDDTTAKDQMVSDISSVITACNTMESEIDLLTTVDEIKNYTESWPVI